MTSTVTEGASVMIASAKIAAASMMCSQVSRISSRLPVAQVGEDRVELRAAGLLGQAQAAGHGVRQQLGVAQRGERDLAGPVPVLRPDLVGGAARHPRLAHAARAHQRDQPVVTQQRLHAAQLGRPADKVVGLRGELLLPLGGVPDEHVILIT